METVETNIDSLLYYRKVRNCDLFATDLGNGRVRLSTQATGGIILVSEVAWKNSEYQRVRGYCNQPVHFDSLMLRTHDFADMSSWGETSLYQLLPYAGYKLVITSIVARFPAAVDLSVNNLYFRVYKSYDNKNPVTDEHQPVVNDIYTAVTDLVKISNSSLTTIPDPSGQFAGEMYEIKFRYADSDLANQSKLTISSLLNERMEVGMQHDIQLVDTAGNSITDPCYLFFNTKRVEDF